MRRQIALLCLTTLLLLGSVADLNAQASLNVAEVNAQGYQLLYDLAIPNMANFRNGNAVPYSVDNSATVGFYDRVAYYLELDSGTGTRYVYSSFDSISSNPSQLGLPHNVNNPVIFQQIVNNANIASNVGGIVTGNGISTVNVEFWSTNYNGSNAIGIPNASGSAFDFGDGGAGIGAGHASFQVHNHGAGATQTLFAYNNWGGSNPTTNSDVGIGTNTGTVITGGGPVGVGGQPDWTFAPSANLYSVKNLQVLVRPSTAPPTQSALSVNPGLVANAPEASTFSVVYELPVQSAAFNAGQYTINDSANFANGSFDRVAYYLELDGPSGPQFAYVSMDPFTAEADRLGVPRTDFFQQLVNNMNVISDVAGVVEGEGITTGNIEFWPSNYNQSNAAGVPGANGGTFDFGDGGANLSIGHGSMQIHNYGAGQTILAYNQWGTQNGGLGIGNRPGSPGDPDWTFANNSGTYTLKNLYVLANVAGAVLESTPGDGATIDLGFILPGDPATLSDAITLENTGATNSIIDVVNFSITGDDAALFDVPDFARTLLQADVLDTVMFDVSFLGASTPGDYSALLTFDTSEGPLSFQLAAVVTPEPTSIAMWLLIAAGLAAFGYNARCRQVRQ